MNTCRLCKSKPAAWNNFVCEDCSKSATFQTKAGLILEDSSHSEWGLVHLSPGSMGGATPPEDSQLVGYWHKYEDGTVWVSLMEPVKALMDRTTLLHAELARRRAEGLPLIGAVKAPRQRRTSSGPKKEIEQQPEPQKNDIIESLQALRDKLRSQAS